MPTKLWSHSTRLDLLDSIVAYQQVGGGGAKVVMIPRSLLPQKLPPILTDPMVANLKALMSLMCRPET